MKLQKRKEDLTRKQEQLEKAKIALKQEYFGIDTVIDRVIENMSSWYLFPEFQKRPHVINLWGMTGTGKTSLVQRLTELLDLKESLYSFEMSKNSKYRVQDTLNDLYDNNSKKPIILMFDEFQHLRSLDEDGRYHENDMAQIIWKIIDSGKFENYRLHSFENNEIRKIAKLKKALKKGVKVTKGEVVEKKKLFIKTTNIDLADEDNYFHKDPAYMKRRGYIHDSDSLKLKEVLKKRRIRFVGYELMERIVRTINRPEISLASLDKMFSELNGAETIQLIENFVKESLAPKIIDCSKAIVFVCGNLDNAYPMSNYLSPDIDADIFYDESLRVNIGDIKRSLGGFLRREQIARLGNTHLIYPALSKKAYQDIIHYQLSVFKQEVWKEYEIELKFTAAVQDLIYQEGVYPAQGTRPLFSTIKQFIQIKWSKVVGEIFLKEWDNVNQIRWDFSSDKFEIEYGNKDGVVGEVKLEAEMPLKEIRSKQDEEDKVIVSVHEAGHALVYRILEKKSPKLILTSMASNDSAGLVITENRKNYSRNSGIKQLAIMVAGYCAEKSVFGTESITYGASDDLFRAENLANNMVKDWGFQKFETSRVYQESFIRKRESGLDARQLMDEAFTIAADVIKKYEKTLVNLSDTLMQKKCLYQDEIETLFKEQNPTLVAAENACKSSEMYSMQFKEKLNEWKP